MMKGKSNEDNTKQQLFENLMTYKQLSNWLGVPISTLQKWVHRKEIPFYKGAGGRHVRFDKDDIKNRLLKKELDE